MLFFISTFTLPPRAPSSRASHAHRSQCQAPAEGEEHLPAAPRQKEHHSTRDSSLGAFAPTYSIAVLFPLRHLNRQYYPTGSFDGMAEGNCVARFGPLSSAIF